MACRLVGTKPLSKIMMEFCNSTLRNKLQWNRNQNLYIFCCDQAALLMAQSIRPSVCLSVTAFILCSHHRIIMKFSVITNDRWWCPCKRSRSEVKEVTTQLNHFKTITPVWIHKWWWNDAYSLMLLRRGALLFFKVICQISRSHGSKNHRIWPRLGVSGL